MKSTIYLKKYDPTGYLYPVVIWLIITAILLNDFWDALLVWPFGAIVFGVFLFYTILFIKIVRNYLTSAITLNFSDDQVEIVPSDMLPIHITNMLEFSEFKIESSGTEEGPCYNVSYDDKIIASFSRYSMARDLVEELIEAINSNMFGKFEDLKG